MNFPNQTDLTWCSEHEIAYPNGRECPMEQLKSEIARLEMRAIPVQQQFEDWAEQNARYHKALARLTAAASKVWSLSSRYYVREELGGRLRELSDAMDEAREALGAEAGGEGAGDEDAI